MFDAVFVCHLLGRLQPPPHHGDHFDIVYLSEGVEMLSPECSGSGEDEFEAQVLTL